MIRVATEEDCGRLAEINVFAWRLAYRNIISDTYLFKKRSVVDTWKSLQKRLKAREG